MLHGYKRSRTNRSRAQQQGSALHSSVIGIEFHVVYSQQVIHTLTLVVASRDKKASFQLWALTSSKLCKLDHGGAEIDITSCGQYLEGSFALKAR